MTLVCDPTARGEVPETRWPVLLGLLLSLALGVVTPAFALTTYYVAPGWAGPQNGTASQPWASLSASGAWAAINGSLATNDVTVYFTSRKAASDTDETTTTQLSLERTNSSTNRLTLDGMSQYNTNDAAPSWAAYSGSSRFKITAQYPISTSNFITSPLLPRNYVTVRGFKAVSTGTSGDTQTANFANVSHFIFEYNDLMNTTTGGGSNNLLLGSQAGQEGTFGSDVIIRNNFIHESPAEAIYVGGYYYDGTALTARVSWRDLLIENNTIINAGRVGEGNAIDVKDGSVNTIIRANIVQQLTQPTSPGYSDIGIVAESCAVIEKNFVTGFAAGIGLVGAYNNTNGRNGCEIRNNVVASNTARSWDAQITLRGSSAAAYRWINTKVLNNTVYGGNKDGITVSSADPAPHNSVSVSNNICAENSGAQLSVGAGLMVAHSNNLFWRANGGTLVREGASSYTAGTITSFEATAKAVDPLLVNPTVGAGASGFKLQATSPAIGTAIILGSFSNDYANQTRIVPWDMGAWAFSSATGIRPQPPTSLSVR